MGDTAQETYENRGARAPALRNKSIYFKEHTSLISTFIYAVPSSPFLYLPKGNLPFKGLMIFHCFHEGTHKYSSSNCAQFFTT